MKNRIELKISWIHFLVFSLVSMIGVSCSNNSTKPSGPAFSMVSPFSYVTLGIPGSGSGQLNDPTDLAFDKNGNIYVMDNGNQRIQKFNSTGNYITQWPIAAAGVGAWGIAVDNNGFVYATGSGTDLIYKYNSNGVTAVPASWSGAGSGFNNPKGISIDANGYVYVSDVDANRIQKFDSSGHFILMWGTAGSGQGQFNGPGQIGFDKNGNVYIPDNGNQRIQKFDANGNYLSQFGDNTVFASPVGVDVDGNGNIYVTDDVFDQVFKFDASGNYVLKWGGNGTGLGQFNKLTYPRVDSSNNVWVVEEFNSRIQMTSYAYTFSDLNTFGIFPNPVKNGQLVDFEFALNPSSSFSIVIKDSQGTVVNQYQGQAISNPTILQWNMTSPDGTLVEPGVYFVNFQSGSIQKKQELTYAR